MFKLNLQLFATVTQTTLLNTPPNDLSPEMKTYYEKRLLTLAEPNLVHNQFGDKYQIPRNGGKTIELRKWDSLPKATTPLTEGVTPDGQNMNVTAITATIAQYGGWIRQSDLLELTAIDNTIVQANKMLANQASRTIDTLTRDIITAGSNVIYAPTWSGTTPTEVSARSSMNATSVISVDLIMKAAAQLKEQNAPTINGNYVAIVHPYVAYDLMRSDEWIDFHKYDAPENLFNGEIGRIGNVRFVESTEAKIWKSQTDSCPSYIDSGTKYYAVFATLVLGANAFATVDLSGGGLEFIVKQKGSAGTEDPLNQRSSIGWKTTHVAKRLIEQYMVRIESLSAYSKVASAN